jgi:hypothetical protein
MNFTSLGIRVRLYRRPGIARLDRRMRYGKMDENEIDENKADEKKW